MEKLLETLECPICLERLTPPVKLCENEHAVCELKCGKRLKECPICRADFYCTTNKFINQFLEAMPMACPNAINGCFTMLPSSEMLRHEKICNHKLVRCFRCSANNIIYSELGKHLSNSECGFPSFFLCNFGSFVYYDIKSLSETKRQIFVIQEQTSNALFRPKYHVDFINKILYMCVEYIGKREDAKKYLYEIKFPQGHGLWFSQGNFCAPFFDLNEELTNHPNVLNLDMDNVFMNNIPPALRFHFKIIPVPE